LSYLTKKEVSKILILGLQASGKTTIINTVTEGIIPKEDEEYLPTIDYVRKKVVIAGKELIIFDLGGQTTFLDRFTTELSEFIFSGVKSLIFVVDSVEIKEISRAKFYLDIALKALSDYSPSASAYLFQHKTDLIPVKLREEVNKTIHDHLLVDTPMNMKYYETSVFDPTILNAMGEVFAGASDVDETLKPLIETFISHNEVEMAQVFTKEGVPLIHTETTLKCNYISLPEVKKVFNSVIKNLANSEDQTSSSVLFESNNRVFIFKFTESGLILFLGFHKDHLQEKHEPIPSLFSKALKFSLQLENLRQ
jgi:GTPase SAR1 family protein